MFENLNSLPPAGFRACGTRSAQTVLVTETFRREGFFKHALYDVYDGALGCAAVEVCLALGAETNRSCNARKERVVRADADVLAGKNFRTALTDDYLPNIDFLAVGALDAEVFRI